VLKKHIHANRSGVALYSANVRKPFGFVHVANAGNLQYGGALWSIDSDFDCRHVAVGEAYSITDHCGQMSILTPSIEPRYLARQVLQAGLDQGFSRDYRPSLGLMTELEINIPAREDGEFDFDIMKTWADFSEEMEGKSDEIAQLAK
jgi:type I restriction enzyme M protein